MPNYPISARSIRPERLGKPQCGRVFKRSENPGNLPNRLLPGAFCVKLQMGDGMPSKGISLP
jgi:hypothetical protein